MDDLRLTVTDLTGLATRRPVTGGVPLPEGAAPPGTPFALVDSAGAPQPLQTQVLAAWPDGSIRWLLLDFAATPPPRGAAAFCLRAGGPVQAAAALATLEHDADLARIAGRLAARLALTDGDGRSYASRWERAEVEADGPLRRTVTLHGALTGESGRAFQARLRVSTFAGSTLARLEPLILIDTAQGVMQRVRELALELSAPGMTGARLGGADAGAKRLFQLDDRQYQVDSVAAGEHAPGWAELATADGPVAVALRSFWQQWPKAIAVRPDGISLGLLPRIEPGTYDHLADDTKYGYLFDGDCYRLRTGQARRWEVWVDLAGEGPALAAHAAAPLVPAADPGQAIATGVWGAIAPAGAPGMAEYDAWADNLFAAYHRSIEVQRDYGAMNWGDWYGERRVNWGNHEYDTAEQFLLQFARTADPRYFHAADDAARHSSEVDTVHALNDDLVQLLGVREDFPARPGLVHQHTVGHVSGFYPNETIRDLLIEAGVGEGRTPYLCLDPYNLGHIWTGGMARQHLLTGDPFLKETVERIGENLAQLVEDRKYHFMGHNHCGRTTGWPLIALSGAFELGLAERYRTAMRTLVDDALAEQDPNCGGWLYTMSPGHCNCRVKHVGMAGFITAVLVNGLAAYHRLTRDERLPEAIGRAVTCLDRDTWHDEWSDWRYTPCPATGKMGQFGVIMMAYVNAVTIAGNPEHRRVLAKAWAAKFTRLLQAPPPRPGFGKEYTSIMYGCAETCGLLAGE